MPERSAGAPAGRRVIWCSSSADDIAGCAPCYLKAHSQGEYVFDHSWAEAFMQAGGDYYPKLQIAVPFTPVPGRRLLVRPGPDGETHERMLAAGAAEIAERNQISGVHITFLSEGEWCRLGTRGFLQRTDQQFHWSNAGYGTFDDYLASLASRKRKAMRKEREQALAAGLTVEWLRGSEITEADWDAFFAFYTETGSRKWGRPYLNRKFFSLLGASSVGGDCLLMLAKRGNRAIAGSLHHDRRRLPVRPLLGRRRAPSLPAFRALLLPGDRLRHSAQDRPRGSGRARRAQAGAGISADQNLFGALHRQPGTAPRDRRLSGARARSMSMLLPRNWRNMRRSAKRRRPIRCDAC